MLLRNIKAADFLFQKIWQSFKRAKKGRMKETGPSERPAVGAITPRHRLLPVVGIPSALVAHQNVSKTLVCSDVALSPLQGRRASVFTRLRDGRVYFSSGPNLKCLVLMFGGDLLRPLNSPRGSLHIYRSLITPSAPRPDLRFSPSPPQERPHVD